MCGFFLYFLLHNFLKFHFISTCIKHGFIQQKFYLSINTTKLIGSPFFQDFIHFRVKP